MTSDHFSVRVVVVTLAVCTVAGVAAVAALSFLELTIPDQLDRLVTLTAGALIGILARTSSSADPQAVKVENPPEDPVMVDPIDPAPVKKAAAKKAAARRNP